MPRTLIRPTFPAVILISLIAVTGPASADVDSGPAVGNPVPELTVYAVTGDIEQQEVDYAAERGDAPTIYMFIPHNRWSRPMARFLREVDAQLTDIDEDASIVAVWLTEDQFQTRNYLPRAQAALKTGNTAFTYYSGDLAGPGDWGLNGEADITVVVTAGGEIAATFGFVSVNETVAEDVLEALQNATSTE